MTQDLLPSTFFPCEDRTITLESVAVHRAVEAAAAGSLGATALMSRAGQVSADLLCSLLGNRTPDERLAHAIWFFAGPGNNGGDALCAARELHIRGWNARVCLPVAPRPASAAQSSHDSAEGSSTNDTASAWALREAQAAGVPIVAETPGPDQLHHAACLVDGLFGIGLGRPIDGKFAEVTRLLNAHTAGGGMVLALDIPSGLDADNGGVLAGSTGEHLAVEASHTLTFLAGKPGLFTRRGKDLSGQVFIAPLGLSDKEFDAGRANVPSNDHHLRSRVRQQGIELNTPERFVPFFPRRRPSSHKGTFGSIAVVGGDTGTCGAAILAARAALYCGAGRIHTALVGDGGPAYDPPHPEIMMRRVDAINLESMDALAIGPGLGKSERASGVLRHVIGLQIPTLIDADALNLIATQPALAKQVNVNGEHIVITPHPGEAARLLGVQTADIEADRIAAVLELAQTFGCTALLKGSGTLIANAQGRVAINATGNAGLSSGGTGDVLSGVIGAFLSQGLRPFEAALAGSWVHGRAAEALSAAGIGPAGLSAGELAPEMRRLLNTLFRQFRLS